MRTEVWQGYLRKACRHKLTTRTFAAFNTNVDVVAHVTNEKLQRLLRANPDIDMDIVRSRSIDDIKTITSKEDFLVVLKEMLGQGKSFHIVLEGKELMDWLDKQFPDEKESMGGQAGIIANQMASLGATAVVYTPLLSAKQASLFDERVTTPIVTESGIELEPVRQAARPEDSTKINWIFEYAKGIEIDFGFTKITTPRANRVIVATRPSGSVMSFQEPLTSQLAELGTRIDVAFMAGYHYVEKVNPDGRSYDEFMRDTIAHLHALRSSHPDLRLHYEYVPMKYAEMESATLLKVAEAIESFGINENEIKRVLTGFGFVAEADEIAKNERAYSLYVGGLRLLEKMNLTRIQVHNLGYYVLVLRKPYSVNPELVRQACLFASSVNAMKAKYGGYPTPERLDEASEMLLSDIGYRQLESFAEELAAKHGIDAEAFVNSGYVEMDDHIVMLVPAHVVQNPVSTVGMGDTISSSSYAMETELALEQMCKAETGC